MKEMDTYINHCGNSLDIIKFNPETYWDVRHS